MSETNTENEKNDTSATPGPSHYGLGNYGSLPISFQQFYLTDDVLQYLQSDPIFSDAISGDNERLTQLGYCKSVDYPERPDHIYYEAYFHSLPTHEPIETIHPRYGVPHQKPAGSLVLASYYESIRRKNALWTEKLKESLRTIPGDASALVIEILDQNRHFAG
jgi:hypothetical protein